MVTAFRKGAAICALTTAFFALTPAYAAPGVQPGAPAGSTFAGIAAPAHFDWSEDGSEARTAQWRGRHRWGRRGWRGRRRGVDAGDVLAGAAILGGIAIIANAASDRGRPRDVVDDRYERDREWQQQREIENLRRRTREQQREIDDLRTRDYDRDEISSYDDDRDFTQDVEQRFDIDAAIDRCVEVMEIDAEISGIDSVTRTDSGWSIEGQVAGGDGFACRVDRNGQIRGLENRPVAPRYDAGFDPTPAAGQWTADRYADARASLRDDRNSDRLGADQDFYGEAVDPDLLPAYPGGPLPGEAGG